MSDTSRIRRTMAAGAAVVGFTVAGCSRDASVGPPTQSPQGPAAAVPAGPYVPGRSYFGRNGYIEYMAGNAPVIISAPHGGALAPSEIPERTCGANVTDTNTETLARTIRDAFHAATGTYPHVIINRLARSRLDANREGAEATCGNAAALAAWEEWHELIEIAKARATAAAGRAWYVDLHGHGHAVARLELGYLLAGSTLDLADGALDVGTVGEQRSSLRRLSVDDSTTSFVQLLRGPASLGALFAQEGYRAVPSPADPSPMGSEYFSGGYNTARHTCRDGGLVCGVQIEANYAGVRDTEANRQRFAQALVRVTRAFLRDRWGLVP